MSEHYAKAVGLAGAGKAFPLHRQTNEYVVLDGKGEPSRVQLAGADARCDYADFRYRT